MDLKMEIRKQINIRFAVDVIHNWIFIYSKKVDIKLGKHYNAIWIAILDINKLKNFKTTNLPEIKVLQIFKLFFTWIYGYSKVSKYYMM